MNEILPRNHRVLHVRRRLQATIDYLSRARAEGVTFRQVQNKERKEREGVFRIGGDDFKIQNICELFEKV